MNLASTWALGFVIGLLAVVTSTPEDQLQSGNIEFPDWSSYSEMKTITLFLCAPKSPTA